MKKLTLSLIVMTGLMLMMIGVVSATTPEEDAIIAGADRLVATQNNDGSWEWINPDTNKTYNADGRTVCNSNIVGVIALGLVDAYQSIGTQTYLDAAEISGDALVACGYNKTTDKYYSQDIEFLVELGEATGNSTYTYKAVEIMEYFMVQDNRYCDSDGCTAAELAAFYQAHFGSPDEGMTEWQLASWVRAAQVTGKINWANNMIAEMNNDISGTPYFNISNPGDFGVIGLSGVVSETGNVGAKQALLDSQNMDGSWNSGNPESEVQDTAYAVMALVGEGETASATWGKNWLVSDQDPNGGWSYNSTENTEITSESIQAIFDVIAVSNVGGVGADFVALSVPNFIDYGTLFSTPGFETEAQAINLTNVGSLNVTVTPIWASGAEVFKRIKFSDDDETYGMITDGVGTESIYYTTNIGAIWVSGTTFENAATIWTKIKIASGLAKLVGPQTGTIYFQAVEV